MFMLILGIETLAKFGTFLDFQEKSIQIDHTKIAMRPYKSLAKNLIWVIRHPKWTIHTYVPDGKGTFSIDHLEPISTWESTKRTIKIIDAEYNKSDLLEIVTDTCRHVSSVEQINFLRVLTKYEKLFGGTLGDFDTDPVKFNLQMGAKTYHRKSYSVPQRQKAVFKKEVEQLCEIGVLKRHSESEWGSPAFIIPRFDQTVRFLTNFREGNKRIMRTPFMIPKISSILQEMEGFKFATVL